MQRAPDHVRTLFQAHEHGLCVLAVCNIQRRLTVLVNRLCIACSEHKSTEHSAANKAVSAPRRTFKEAPCSASMRTTSTWPRSAAACRGVRSIWRGESASAWFQDNVIPQRAHHIQRSNVRLVLKQHDANSQAAALARLVQGRAAVLKHGAAGERGQALRDTQTRASTCWAAARRAARTLSCALMSAAFASSTFATSKCPFSDAACSAVRPCCEGATLVRRRSAPRIAAVRGRTLPLAPGLAPEASSSLTTSKWPLSAAACSAVQSSCVGPQPQRLMAGRARYAGAARKRAERQPAGARAAEARGGRVKRLRRRSGAQDTRGDAQQWWPSRWRLWSAAA